MTSRTYALPSRCGTVLLATALAACGTVPAGARPSTRSQQRRLRLRASPIAVRQHQPGPAPNAVSYQPNVKNGASKVKVDTLVKVVGQRGNRDQGQADLHRQGQPG